MKYEKMLWVKREWKSYCFDKIMDKMFAMLSMLFHYLCFIIAPAFYNFDASAFVFNNGLLAILAASIFMLFYLIVKLMMEDLKADRFISKTRDNKTRIAIYRSLRTKERKYMSAMAVCIFLIIVSGTGTYIVNHNYGSYDPPGDSKEDNDSNDEESPIIDIVTILLDIMEVERPDNPPEHIDNLWKDCMNDYAAKPVVPRESLWDTHTLYFEIDTEKSITNCIIDVETIYENHKNEFDIPAIDAELPEDAYHKETFLCRKINDINVEIRNYKDTRGGLFVPVDLYKEELAYQISRVFLNPKEEYIRQAARCALDIYEVDRFNTDFYTSSYFLLLAQYLYQWAWCINPDSFYNYRIAETDIKLSRLDELYDEDSEDYVIANSFCNEYGFELLLDAEKMLDEAKMLGDSSFAEPSQMTMMDQYMFEIYAEYIQVYSIEDAKPDALNYTKIFMEQCPKDSYYYSHVQDIYNYLTTQ